MIKRSLHIFQVRENKSKGIVDTIIVEERKHKLIEVINVTGFCFLGGNDL